MSDIKQLEDAYYKAVNHLIKYRYEKGLNPGVRVKAQCRDEPPKFGTIAPFGKQWISSSHTEVPVLLDNGQLQPWSMSNLEVIPQ